MTLPNTHTHTHTHRHRHRDRHTHTHTHTQLRMAGELRTQNAEAETEDSFDVLINSERCTKTGYKTHNDLTLDKGNPKTRYRG